jgi:uncharacterized protein
MRAILFLIELLLWLLLIRIVLRGLARLFAGAVSAPPRRDQPPPPRAIEDLVLDRVCRTYLPRSRALTARVGGREEHFCSPACRDAALAELARAS